MRYIHYLFLILIPLLISCDPPDDSTTDLYPYLMVDYRFSDADVAVFSKRMAITKDNSAVYYCGERTDGFEYNIFKRKLTYSDDLIQVTATGTEPWDGGAYSMDVDGIGDVLYHRAWEFAPDSVRHYIVRAGANTIEGSPAPEVKYSFDGALVGFRAFRGDQADYFSVSSDAQAFMIGWDDTGFHYINFRDGEPTVIDLPTAVEALVRPDGVSYVYVDGSSNIYLNSTLLNSPVLIGNGRYVSVSSNDKIAYVKNDLFHVYDVNTQETKVFYPPKNVANVNQLMNSTISEDGLHVAIRVWDPSDSDVIVCSIPQ